MTRLDTTAARPDVVARNVSPAAIPAQQDAHCVPVHFEPSLAARRAQARSARPQLAEPECRPRARGQKATGFRVIPNRVPDERYYSQLCLMCNRQLTALREIPKSEDTLSENFAEDAEERIGNHWRSCLEALPEQFESTSPKYDMENAFVMMELDRDLAELLAAASGDHRYCFMPEAERNRWVDYLRCKLSSEPGEGNESDIRRAYYCYELELLVAAKHDPERCGHLPLSYKQEGIIRTREELTADRDEAEKAAAKLGYHSLALKDTSERNVIERQLQQQIQHGFLIAAQKEFNEKSPR